MQTGGDKTWGDKRSYTFYCGGFTAPMPRWRRWWSSSEERGVREEESGAQGRLGSSSACAVLAWLNAFNADLYLKRSCRGPRYQEMGGGGGGGGARGDYFTPHCHHHNDYIKMGKGKVRGGGGGGGVGGGGKNTGRLTLRASLSDTHTHARARARTHARTHAHTHTHTPTPTTTTKRQQQSSNKKKRKEKIHGSAVWLIDTA